LTRRKPANSDDADDGTTCRNCQHFHERTKLGDRLDWGECWITRPVMRPVPDDETDQATWQPVNQVIHLPYRCGDLKPKVQ
jgi:hypothetical protein